MQVRDTVINPILKALGWDVQDPEKVRTEFEVEKGKDGSADYALLRKNAPIVFIEAKKIGGIKEPKKPGDKDDREQLFNYYRADRRPRFLILTDGRRWDFYLARLDEEAFDEMLFHRMELTSEDEISGHASDFKRYLDRNRVINYKSLKVAEDVYEKKLEKKKIGNAIPDVWRELLDTPNQALRDLLVREVRSKFENEHKPKPNLADTREEVDSFLRDLRFNTMSAPSRSKSRRSTTPSPSQSKKSASIPSQSAVGKKSKLVGFSLEKESVNTSSARETLAEILKKLQDRDPGFMDRLAKETVGRKRRLVARDRNDLYDDPKFVERSSLDLGNGWWVGHHLSTRNIKKKIETACEVAGVKFGSQLKLIER